MLFALHHYRPSPFLIMDEVDAALGECGAILTRRSCVAPLRPRFVGSASMLRTCERACFRCCPVDM